MIKTAEKKRVAGGIFQLLGGRLGRLAGRDVLDAKHIEGEMNMLVKLAPLPEDGQGDFPIYVDVKVSFPTT